LNLLGAVPSLPRPASIHRCCITSESVACHQMRRVCSRSACIGPSSATTTTPPTKRVRGILGAGPPLKCEQFRPEPDGLLPAPLDASRRLEEAEGRCAVNVEETWPETRLLCSTSAIGQPSSRTAPAGAMSSQPRESCAFSGSPGASAFHTYATAHVLGRRSTFLIYDGLGHN
jgi:hypothetical protein